jgi:hypothetical protein
LQPARTVDEWFAALEGRRVRRAGKSWRVEVVGIHALRPYHWFQVRLAGRPAKEVLVRVPPGTTPEVVLHALADAVTSQEREYRIPTLDQAA